METINLVKEFWADTVNDVNDFLNTMKNRGYEIIEEETFKRQSQIFLTFKTNKNKIDEICSDLKDVEKCWMQLLKEGHKYNNLGRNVLTLAIKPNNIKYANSFKKDKK